MPPKAHSPTNSITPLSPAAQRLQHLLHKLPIAREDEAAVTELHKVIKACSKEELASLSLQPPAIPSLCLTSISSHQPLPIRLQAVQACISSFQYNHSSGYNYNVAKKRPLQAILATAAGILANPLPIKCIEAVFLGMLLTQGWTQLQRLPLGFKSRGSDGKVYRHIVLALCDTCASTNGHYQYGALGLSRCPQLMDKQPQYASLSVLVDDYHAAYRHVGHELLKVRVGLPVEHEASWMGPVCWRFCTVNMQQWPWREASELLNRHAAAAADLALQFRQLAASQQRTNNTSSSKANTSAGSRSVPASPRGCNSPRSPAAAGPPHIITRPHSALGIHRCNTLTEQEHSPLGSVKSPP